ncbi:peptide deformylase [Candidatus Gottesmanbacteria bacterium RIFCSPHIGHO2_02_FULL_39_11]|uniref:Peptide deformylase n=1 Tax=Candidatus Gottesmanbacteria bacterium RIFCSPHIGHO2_02_FULL_39_11 TaxID=1798382 RepID=A0A1F5ZNJ0_9BACT|nr:MAG: peptide deformylase [Candidatus Gottesmanbacteria bacterium RIFCSPHIGHO2_02_FULL_39_11]
MIITIPNKVLVTKAKKVESLDKKVKDIVAVMKKDLVATKNPKGVGLAAPQIGVSLRIFMAKPTSDSTITTFINPEILETSDDLSEIERPEGPRSLKKDQKLEGCLSIPGVWGHLRRASWVKVKYLNENGEEKIEIYKGFMATIIQHECDHLDGILYTQRVLEQKEKLFSIETNEKGEETLEEIRI